MGLDGIAPLNSGICTPDQREALLERIFSSKHLWTEVGITTIDQSAPYYNPDGYWNGAVWMAHQWFLWKTMLDLGRADLALRIANTALNAWKKSTDDTYNCYERFIVKAGAGDGWPQFSSLSSPVLSWFHALYTAGRLTCGFEVWQEQCEFTPNNQTLRALLRTPGARSGEPWSVLVCMAPGSAYRATWNGRPITVRVIHDQLLQIDLTYEAAGGELRISRL